MERYTIVKHIGAGSYGSVKLVLRNSDKKQFAMKQISVGNEISPNTSQSGQNEEAIHKLIPHPTIVRLIDRFEFTSGVNQYHCLVMEYCDAGDLSHIIRKQIGLGKPFCEKNVIDALEQITLGLTVLHGNNIIHRDIKPQNIFVTKNGTLKLGDLGLSKQLAQGQSQASAVGTRLYMAPEVLQKGRFTAASDMWSLGCVLYELLALKPAFHRGGNEFEMLSRIKEGKYNEMHSPVTCELWNVLTSLLKTVESERSCATNLLSRIFKLQLAKSTSQMEKYRTLRDLGQGSFGAVKLIQRISDQQLLAMKMVEDIDHKRITSTTSIRAKTDEATLKLIKHPCIVRVFDSFEYEANHKLYYCLVMEYCDAGDLSHHISNQRKIGKPFREDKVVEYLLQITFALKVLHSRSIIHRDIKPQNILMTRNGTLKLGDFGLVKELVIDESGVTATLTGTAMYKAPEVLLNNRISTASDMWSLGCVLYELLALTPAFDCGQNIEEMLGRIKVGDFNKITRQISVEFMNTLNSLLDPVERKRPTAAKLLEVFKEPFTKLKETLKKRERADQTAEENVPTTCEFVEATPAPLQAYQVVKAIGQGSFGVVTLVEGKLDKRKYVLKEIEDFQKSIELGREEETLRAIAHHHVVQIVNTFIYKNERTRSSFYCLVMEFCAKGDLQMLIAAQAEKGELFPVEDIRVYFQQLCSALVAIHSRKIIHRDIKPQNIFVAASGSLKLGDFGLTKILHLINNRTRGGAIAPGTWQYLAPEIFSGQNYGTSADVWSLGCVVYELMKLKPAFDCQQNLILLVEQITSGIYEKIKSGEVDRDLVDTVEQMLQINASKRPSAATMLFNSTLVFDANDKLAKFAFQGMFPLVPDDEGNYLPVNWEDLAAEIKYKEEWTDMVKGNENSAVHFPPMKVLEDIFCVIHFKRHGNDLQFSGGFHIAVSKDAVQINVILQVEMVFHNNNADKLNISREIVATLKRLTEFSGYSVLFTASDLPWNQLSQEHPPHANLIRIKTTNLFPFNFQGMSPIEPDAEGNYSEINWGQLPAAINYVTCWSEMVKGCEIYHLHFPPLKLSDNVVVVLFYQRGENDLQFWGGFHRAVSRDTPALNVNLHLKITLFRSDGERIEFDKEIVAMMDHEVKDCQYPRLLTIPDIPWKSLSNTSPPIATEIRMGPDNSPMSRFSLFGMSPMSPNDEWKYSLVNWQQLQAAINYKAQWSEMVNGNEDVALHLPPLVVVDEIVAILFCQRKGKDLIFYGGFHSAVSRDVDSFNIVTQIGITFWRRNTRILPIEMEKEIISPLTHDYSCLLTFNDIPWELLSSSHAPLANFIRINTTTSPVTKYVFQGMSPVEPDEEGAYPSVDWLRGPAASIDLKRWSDMLKGSKQRLYFPPMKFSEDIVIVLFFGRQKNNFQFLGGFHSAVSRDVTPFDVTLQMNMLLFCSDGGNIELKKEIDITLTHRSADVSYPFLVAVPDIPWQLLSAAKTPLITLIRMTPSKSRFSYYGMSLMMPNVDGNFECINFDQLPAAVNYMDEWTDMIQGNTRAALDFPPLNIMDEIVAVLSCHREGKELRFTGGLHQSISRDTNPISVILQIKMILCKDNNEEIKVEGNAAVILEHKTADNLYYTLLTMFDFPWEHLSQTRAPRSLVRIARNSSPMSKFVLLGMLPVPSIDESKYAEIDWGKLQSIVNSMEIWRRMVMGNENAILHCPPLILSEDIVVILCLTRRGVELLFVGGFHYAVCQDTAPVKVIMHIKMLFNKCDGENFVLEKKTNVTLDHEVPNSGHYVLFTMKGIPWRKLSMTKPPVATLIIMRPTSNESS